MERPHPTHSRRARRGLLAATSAVALAVLWRWVRPLRRVAVTGSSMEPAMRPGDRLLVVRPWPARTGQVVAVADPRDTRRILVKRVAAVQGDGLDVRGDNEARSTDSRHFGPVSRELVIGRAVYRYHPPSRAGWWP